MLIPLLLSVQTIILVNATFHNLEKIRELIENAEWELKYLLPYCSKPREGWNINLPLRIE